MKTVAVGTYYDYICMGDGKLIGHIDSASDFCEMEEVSAEDITEEIGNARRYISELERLLEIEPSEEKL